MPQIRNSFNKPLVGLNNNHYGALGLYFLIHRLRKHFDLYG